MTENSQLPPASFEFLVYSLLMQAQYQLGVLGADKDAPPPDLRIAQHTIDLLAMLQEKTKGNLELNEKRVLENSLTELRFRYVEAAGAAKQAPITESGGDAA